MPDYRRRLVPGGTWFFTVTLLDRRSTLLTDNIDLLREATRCTLRRYPFRIDAFVVLPEHLHAIWTLPEDDTDFSTRWRMIKTRFVRSLPNTEPQTRSRIERGERGIWQRRFWEHHIRNDEEFGHYADYCAINAVKHGLVRRAIDWPYSSFHRDLQRGIYTDDWGQKSICPASSANRRAVGRNSRKAYCALSHNDNCLANRRNTLDFVELFRPTGPALTPPLPSAPPRVSAVPWSAPA